MQKSSTAWLVAIWAILAAVLFAVLRETYWALMVETLIDQIAHGLGLERPKLMAVLAPLLLAGSISALLVYGAYRIGRSVESREHQAEKLPPEYIGRDKEPGTKGGIDAPINSLPRDVGLLDAIWRVHVGRWGERESMDDFRTDPRSNHFFEACTEIRQKAFEGALPIWGRRKNSSLFEPVPWQFWRNREIIESFAIQPGLEDLWVRFTHALEVGDVPNATSNEWDHFMTNKDAIDRLWPAKSEAPAP